MAELKTKVNNASVTKFIEQVPDEQKRADAFELIEIMTKITGAQPKMWGSSIIGFGSYHYESTRSSQKGDWPVTGFSPRKQNLTIYIMCGFTGHEDLMEKIGKHKTGKSCLYIKRLADIDLKILEKLIKASLKYMKKTYPCTFQ